MNRFLLWYIKGSAIYTIFLIITLIAGAEPNRWSQNSSDTVNWLISFLVALSPIGALIGYIVWFVLKFIFGFIAEMLGFDIFKDKPEKEIRYKTINNGICPYAGKILAEKNTTVLGFNYPTLSPIFNINEDWKIYTSNGKDFGWIDREGYIHKDTTIGGVNLDATMSGEKIGQVYSDWLYVNDEAIGRLSKN